MLVTPVVAPCCWNCFLFRTLACSLNHIYTFGANDVLIILPQHDTYVGCSRLFQHQYKSMGSMVSMVPALEIRMYPAKHIANLSLFPLFVQVHLQALEMDGQQDFVFCDCHFVCLTLAWSMARVPPQLLTGVLWHLCRENGMLLLWSRCRCSVREGSRKPFNKEFDVYISAHTSLR